MIASFGIMQLPIWACVAVIRQPGMSWSERVRGSFRPTADWGPGDVTDLERYRKMLANNAAEADREPARNVMVRFKRNIFG